MASSSAHIDHAIEQEESLINLYESELVIAKKSRQAKQKQQGTESLTVTEAVPTAATAAAAAAQHDDGVDPLDWILRQQPQASVSTLMTSVAVQEERFREDLQDMQATLRSFCFTSVDRLATSTRRQARASEKDQQGGNSKCVSYSFKGYFQFDTSVKADILVDFRLGGDRTAGEARVLSISCNLSSDKEDLTWLQQESKIKGEDETNFSRWIERLSDYLEFDQRRKTSTTEWAQKGIIAQATHVRSKSIVKIPLQKRNEAEMDDGDDDNDSTGRDDGRFLSLVWGWKWKEGRDVLRLSQDSSALGLRQQDLDALVKSCGSCARAIGLVIPGNSQSLDSKVFEGDDATSVSSTHEAAHNGHSRRASKEPVLQDPIDDADDEGGICDSDDEIVYIPTADLNAHVTGQLSGYELKRLDNIKRNETRLANLGLTPTKDKQPAKSISGRQRKRDGGVSETRRRSSSRLSKLPLNEPVGDETEEAAQLSLDAPKVSLASERMKQKWADPEFRAKQAVSRKRPRKSTGDVASGQDKRAEKTSTTSERIKRPRADSAALKKEKRSREETVPTDLQPQSEGVEVSQPTIHAVSAGASNGVGLFQRFLDRKNADRQEEATKNVANKGASLSKDLTTSTVIPVADPIKGGGLFQRYLETKEANGQETKDVATTARQQKKKVQRKVGKKQGKDKLKSGRRRKKKEALPPVPAVQDHVASVDKAVTGASRGFGLFQRFLETRKVDEQEEKKDDLNIEFGENKLTRHVDLAKVPCDGAPAHVLRPEDASARDLQASSPPENVSAKPVAARDPDLCQRYLEELQRTGVPLPETNPSDTKSGP